MRSVTWIRMKRILLQFGFMLSFILSIFLSACGSAPVSTEAPPIPTRTKKLMPVSLDGGSSGPSSGESGQPNPGGVISGDYYALPSSPDIPPADVIQQIAWSPIGG